MKKMFLANQEVKFLRKFLPLGLYEKCLLSSYNSYTVIFPMLTLLWGKVIYQTHQTFRPVYNGLSITIRPSAYAVVALFLYTLK